MKQSFAQVSIQRHFFYSFFFLNWKSSRLEIQTTKTDKHSKSTPFCPGYPGQWLLLGSISVQKYGFHTFFFLSL